MKSVNSGVKIGLGLACLLVSVCAVAQIPQIDAPGQSNFQAQTHFLTFLGSYKPESPTSAAAYYKAIDPGSKKVTFQDWLVADGFICKASDWNPTGPQTITHVASDCGVGKIHADAHVIVLNAADLGFVRNQFIRCVPNCQTKNAIVYTYLENYPVAPFTVNGTRFGNPGGSAFPSQSEADAAIASAITRPVGSLNGQKLDRIADVAFDWAPPQTNPTSSSRFGQLYAYIFHRDAANHITETRNWPNDPTFLAGLNGRTDFPPLFPVVAGDPFAPDLDGRGFKQMPGLCLICHGGKPTALKNGVFPNNGNLNGFRFLPLDATNLFFASSGPQSRASQEADMKIYNLAVLLTVDQSRANDGTGTTRGPHLAEVIKGWYAGFAGDQNMTSPTQNEKFIPTGWVGHEDVYLNTVVTSCRSCHFNREISLDFGTYANFKQESDILQLTLLPTCYPGEVDPNLRPMPAAHLTYLRYWSAQFDPNSNTPHQDLPGYIARSFGFSSTAGYCATGP